MDIPPTSLTLLARLRADRDDDAWRDFVALYGPLVYRLARRRGLDSDSADNIVQAFCVKMLAALPALEYDPARGRFRAWVLTVALNEIRMNRREQEQARRLTEALAEQEREADSGRELEHWWEEAEQRQILKLAVERLQAETSLVHFGVFRMVVIDRQSAERAAETFRIKPEYVHGITSRLRKRLRTLAREIRETWEKR